MDVLRAVHFFGGPQAEVRPTKKTTVPASTCEYRILLNFVYFRQYYLGGIARQIARGYAVSVLNLVHSTSPTKFSVIETVLLFEVDSKKKRAGGYVYTYFFKSRQKVYKYPHSTGPRIFGLLVAFPIQCLGQVRHQLGDGLQRDLKGPQMVGWELIHNGAIAWDYCALCVAWAPTMHVGTSLASPTCLVPAIIGGYEGERNTK